jgi:predicted nucleotidyltransferase
MPPMEFEALMADQLPQALQGEVHALLARKRAGEELASGPRIPPINDFLDAELTRLKDAISQIPVSPPPDWEALDVVFRGALLEVWSGASQPSTTAV